MKEKTAGILNSRATPVICLVLGIIIYQLTYDKGSAGFFGVIELILFIIGIIAALRCYTSWVKPVFLVMLAMGVLISGVNLFHSGSGTSGNPSESPVVVTKKPGGGSGGGVFRDDDTDVDYDVVGVTCNRCNGSKKCPECGGTGKIATEKTSIDLGNGGGTYYEYSRCPLCDGTKICVFCNGTGVRSY